MRGIRSEVSGLAPGPPAFLWSQRPASALLVGLWDRDSVSWGQGVLVPPGPWLPVISRMLPAQEWNSDCPCPLPSPFLLLSLLALAP